MRITAQLVRVSDGDQRWSEAYDGELGDVLALQERIARVVARAARRASRASGERRHR